MSLELIPLWGKKEPGWKNGYVYKENGIRAETEPSKLCKGEVMVLWIKPSQAVMISLTLLWIVASFIPQSFLKYVSVLDPDHGRVWIQSVPLIVATRLSPLGHPTDPSVRGRWRGSLTRTNTPPRRDSQMGASSGRICHRNGNDVWICVLSVCACAHVSLWGSLRARKYMCVVKLWRWKRGWVEERVLWQVCDACFCDGSSDQRAVSCQRLITRPGGV